MDLMQTLHEADGGAGLAALSQNFGLSANQTQAVVENVLPHMLQRIERNTLSRGGVADLVAMMGAVDAGGFANPAGIGSDLGRHQGNALLDQMFGGPDKSRAVAAKASYASGIGESIIKAMLPYIASMVINSIFKRTSGGLGDILSKIPNMGGGPQAPGGRGSSGGGGLEDIFSKIPNIGGGSGQSPNFPGNQGFPSSFPGNQPGAFPDMMPKTGGGGFGQPQYQPGQTPFPRGGGDAHSTGGTIGGSGLPGPEGMGPIGRNPYGDLSDVIRRGGADANLGGSPLWRTIRGMLGGALGFQSRGIVGWLFRLIVMRFGWNILRTLLRRMFMGR